MDEEELDPGFKKALVAYFEGFELVELLDVPIEEVVELLEEYILERQQQIAEYINYGENDDDNEGTD